MTKPALPVSKKQMIMSFLTWFALFYLLLFALEKTLLKKDPADVAGVNMPAIVADKDKYSLGNLPVFALENRTEQNYKLVDPCLAGEEKMYLITLGERTPITCSEDIIGSVDLLAGQRFQIPFATITNGLFSEEGDYKVEVDLQTEEGEVVAIESQPIEFEKPGTFKTLYRNLITKPLFNILVFFVDKLPSHSFGLAIIFLTIVVRIILLVPNQKAMKSQRELQKMQPKINALKEKHKDNQQMLAMETMKIYKSHKINPMSSCWPILLQMPFLIGLYHIVQTGLSPHMAFFLYKFQEMIDLSVVDNWFLGMDLTQPNKYILPLVVGGAQWVAFRMTMIRQKKAKGKEVGKKKEEGMANQMQQMNAIMQWAMPIMIAFFTSIMPAGVGIYWVTSTIFGIGQQWVVNHEKTTPEVKRKES